MKRGFLKFQGYIGDIILDDEFLRIRGWVGAGDVSLTDFMIYIGGDV